MANPKADRLTAYTRLDSAHGSINHPDHSLGHKPSFSWPNFIRKITAEVKFSEATPSKGQLPTVPLFSGSWTMWKTLFSGESTWIQNLPFFFFLSSPQNSLTQNHKEQYHFHWRCYRRVRESEVGYTAYSLQQLNPLSTTILLKALPWPLDHCELFSLFLSCCRQHQHKGYDKEGTEEERPRPTLYPSRVTVPH